MRYPWNNKRVCFLILALALLLGLVFAGIKFRSTEIVKLGNRTLDVAASFDGKLIFSLTPGKILVYSTDDNSMIDQIPVDTSYIRIAYSKDSRLILSAADPAVFTIIKFDQVHDINIANRPFKGSANAKVTLVVFDDYQ